VVAHLDRLPGDAHLHSPPAQLIVVRVRRVAGSRAGPVIARLVAVADGYELHRTSS